MFRGIRSHKVYVPLVTIAGSLGLFLVYYFFYVASQRSYASDRAFRLLSVVGDQLAKRYDRLRDIFAAAMVSGDPSKHLNTFLKGEISDIESTGKDCMTRTGDLKLRLKAKSGGSFSLTAIFGPTKGGTASCALSGDLDLNPELREHFRAITEEYFDDVLIATSSGEVLFQKNLSGLRITNVNTLLPPKASDSKNTKPDGSDQKKPSEKPATAFQDASQFSNVINVKLADADYKLYVQPVPLKISSDLEGDVKPVVCGLWRSDRLQSEIVSIPYSVLIWSTLVLFSIFALVWPLLKVAYMSPSERLGRKHVFYLLFSGLFATATLTAIALNFSYSLRAQEESQEQLNALADRIDNSVKAELVRALTFLDSLDKDDSLRAKLIEAASGGWNPTPNFLESSFFQKANNLGYPYFDSAFWVDNEGLQQYKLTVRDKATPRTPISNEPYFKDVRNERHLKAVRDLDRSLDLEKWTDLRFRFDSLYSPNTGEYFVVLARPSPRVLPSSLNGVPAQMLLTRFVSLIDSVVPAGFGYAVVGHDGTVQFHSSSARNQIEDFFKECRQDPTLKSLVVNQASDYLKINYMGKDQEMLVRPLSFLADPAPSLIVFRDTNYFTTVNVACILVFALLASLFSLPFLVALAIFVFRPGDYPLAGLWPSAKQVRGYMNVIAANVCLTLAFALRFPSMGLNEMLLAVGVVTAVAIVFGILQRKWTKGRSALLGKAFVLAGILVVGRRYVGLCAAGLYLALSAPAVSVAIAIYTERFIKVKYVYLAMALSLLTVLVVLPCFGLFKISYDTVNRLALESQQLAVRDQLAHRAEKIDKYFLELKAKTYVGQRIQETWDRFDDPILYPSPHPKPDHPSHDPPEVSWVEPLIAWSTKWFPSNRLGAEMREMAILDQGNGGSERTSRQAGRPKWTAAQDGDDELLWLQDKAVPEGSLLGVYPLWQLPWAAASLMALLGVLLAAWLYYLIRKVFLADLQDVRQLGTWMANDGGQRNLLVIGHPQSGKSARAAALPGVDVVDLAKAVTTGDWSLQGLHNQAVAVDHFEFDIDNPDTCLAKLKLLEHILYVEKKRVILLSAMDPMFYLVSSSPEIVKPTGPGQEPPAQLLDRWAAVLGLFDKLKMEDITQNYFARVLAEQERPCNEELVCMVRSECDHTAQLRKIGLDMLEAHCLEHPSMPRERFVQELLDRADSYYRVLWSTCTNVERLVLFQLSRDGWANPKNDCALQQLQRRGIVCRRSGFRIMNESFCIFIRTAQYPDEVAKWEEEESHSTWSAMKLGLSTSLLMLGAWLLYTQQDAFQTGIGYLAALGTASGAILNLTKTVKGKGAAGGSG